MSPLCGDMPGCLPFNLRTARATSPQHSSLPNVPRCINLGASPAPVKSCGALRLLPCTNPLGGHLMPAYPISIITLLIGTTLYSLGYSYLKLFPSPWPPSLMQSGDPDFYCGYRNSVRYTEYPVQLLACGWLALNESNCVNNQSPCPLRLTESPWSWPLVWPCHFPFLPIVPCLHALFWLHSFSDSWTCPHVYIPFRSFVSLPSTGLFWMGSPIAFWPLSLEWSALQTWLLKEQRAPLVHPATSYLKG